MIVSIQQPIYDRMRAADVLAHAVRCLAMQFRMNMTRDEAKSNLEARALLLRSEDAVVTEAEKMLEI